jgi:hypothetical protein
VGFAMIANNGTNMKNSISLIVGACVMALVSLSLTGCKTKTETTSASAQSGVMPVTSATQPLPSAATVSAEGVFRVKAGSSAPFTDSSGNVWLPDQGFDGGDVVERDASTKIENTKDPGLYLTEHYSMNSFSCKLPNGRYTAKLYFAETYEGVTQPGDRVFSFNVQGHEFKDFDVWKKAGGPYRACVVPVPVEVTNGIFQITFTAQVENPEINAVEIIPQS